MDDYIDTRRAAERLGVTPMRVRQWINDGTLPAQRLARDYILRVADVDTLRDARERAAESRRGPGRPPGQANKVKHRL